MIPNTIHAAMSACAFLGFMLGMIFGPLWLTGVAAPWKVWSVGLASLALLTVSVFLMGYSA